MSSIFVPVFAGNPRCGGDFVLERTNFEGITITSPNYPSNYPDGVNCTWIFRPTYPTPNAYEYQMSPTLRMSFNGQISIENGADCRYDYLKVRQAHVSLCLHMCRLSDELSAVL